ALGRRGDVPARAVADVDLHVARYRAAVGPPEPGAGAQHVEVAANCLRRHPELAGQGLDVDVAALARDVDDAALACCELADTALAGNWVGLCHVLKYLRKIGRAHV